MTGKQVVPCHWQEPTSGGPMLVASDTPAGRTRRGVVTRGGPGGPALLAGPPIDDHHRTGSTSPRRCCGGPSGAPPPGIWHAASCLAYGGWSWTAGEDGAIEVLTEGAEEAAVHGAPALEAYCNALLAMIAHTERDPARAWPLVARARQVAAHHRFEFLVRQPDATRAHQQIAELEALVQHMHRHSATGSSALTTAARVSLHGEDPRRVDLPEARRRIALRGGRGGATCRPARRRRARRRRVSQPPPDCDGFASSARELSTADGHIRRFPVEVGAGEISAHVADARPRGRVVG